MPVVPMPPRPKGKPGKTPPGPPPSTPFALMAAATMHSEGRLIPSTELPPEPK